MMSKLVEKPEILSDEDYHTIDKELALEAWATLAFASHDITLDEYELHRDEHLRQITSLLNSKSDYCYQETLRQIIDWLKRGELLTKIKADRESGYRIGFEHGLDTVLQALSQLEEG